MSFIFPTNWLRPIPKAQSVVVLLIESLANFTRMRQYNNVGLKVPHDTAPATFRLRKIRSPFVDPKYSADHGPLPHISAGQGIQQKYSINRLYSKYAK